MIVFSRVPEPSSLSLAGDLSRKARALLAQCDEETFLERPGAVDLLWQHAQALDAQGEAEGCAIVSIRLAECFRKCHRLGPALKCAEKAKDIFSKWPHRQQKQNLAVAFYACGLLHQLLGSYQDACECYEEALAVFGEARQQRQSLAITPEFENRCRRAEGTIEELSTYVSRAATCGDWGAIRFCRVMDYWLAERKPLDRVKPEVSVEVKEIVVGMELKLGPQSYQLRGLTGNPDLRLVSQPSGGYLLPEVPDEIAHSPASVRAPAQLRDAAYALVREGIQEAHFGIGSERAKDNELLWGEFIRDQQKNVIIIEANYQEQPLRAPKLVGEDELKPGSAGTIVGVFK